MPPEPGALLSFSAYARHRGVSQPYISKLVRQGTIPVADAARKLIDPAAADAALNASRDPAKQYTVDRHAENRGNASNQGQKPEAGQRPQQPSPPAPEISGYTKARTYREGLNAKLVELSYRERVGELVEVARVKQAIAENIGTAVKALERLPDRIAGRVAAESDPRRVHKIISEELDAVRAEIAQTATALAEQTRATRN